MNKKYIWLSDCFVRIGKCFRKKPEFKITPELLKDLKQARSDSFEEDLEKIQ